MIKLDWVRKIYEDGMHCAFGDLAYWKGQYYACFRRAEAHAVWPYGDVFVIRSPNLEQWEVCGMLTTGLDDRDPALAVDGDRLWVFFGSRYTETDNQAQPVQDGAQWLHAHASYTCDGTSWTVPKSIYERGYWLWRPYRFPDAFYCAAYGRGPEEDEDGVDFLKSPNGLNWTKVSRLIGRGEGNETALYRYEDGRILAVVRGLKAETHFFESPPPYVSWRGWPVPYPIQAPVIARVAGQLVVAGRYFSSPDAKDQELSPGERRTRLWAIEGESVRYLLDLPSGGDTSYAGFVVPEEGKLLVNYYSQHEYLDAPNFVAGRKPASIYLAQVSFS